jgi:hypothetical protein
MSITSIPSLGGTQGSSQGSSQASFNFTNTTISQFGQELQDLTKEGKLTEQQALTAYGNAFANIALSHFSPDGADHITSQSTAQDQNDPTPQNFITEFQNIGYQLHHTAGSVGAPLVESILQALQAYQGTPIPGATGSGPTQT